MADQLEIGIRQVERLNDGTKWLERRTDERPLAVVCALCWAVAQRNVRAEAAEHLDALRRGGP